MATKNSAPYAPGDTLRVLHTCYGGLATHPITLDRVVSVSDGRRWRLEAVRCDGRALHVYVDRDGNDPSHVIQGR